MSCLTTGRTFRAERFGKSRLGPSPAESAFPGANGKIAFNSYRDGNGEIYVMNADGSGQTNLTNNAADERDFAWSADGTKIAFTSDRDGSYSIYVMNADGSGQTDLTNNPAVEDGNPAWSPDGTKIAFHSSRDGNAEIYVMNADGSSPANLSNNPAVDYLPDWQPLVSVGGIFELPDAARAPASQSDSSAPPYAAIAGALATALLVLTAGAWYARRRWLG